MHCELEPSHPFQLPAVLVLPDPEGAVVVERPTQTRLVASLLSEPPCHPPEGVMIVDEVVTSILMALYVWSCASCELYVLIFGCFALGTATVICPLSRVT